MPRHAFSLVELSIVLVILGLLVGGVLSGQSLIRASELRTVSTDFNKQYSAVQAFRDKYFALPGDMNNATSFWGAAAAGFSCRNTASTDAKTCDGDGNGHIDMFTSNSFESARYLQQLASAGLIEGQFDGVTLTAKARISNGFWMTYWIGTAPGNSTIFAGDYGNVVSMSNVLAPEETWNIDTKMDDGKPATGKIVVSGVNTECTDDTTGTGANLAANYLLSATARKCGLYFRASF